MKPIQIRITQLDPDLGLPAYAQPGDAGMDLKTRVDITLQPGQRALAPTGVSIALPHGYVALVHPRSGLALKHGVSVVNTPGTIDAGYRGEIGVILINLDPSSPVSFQRGDRIAQLVIQRVAEAEWVPVDSLDETSRGGGGFGSTGVTDDVELPPSG